MTVELTRHAVKRIRQRLGLPKKAVEKLANEAWANGHNQGEYSGAMRRYLDWVILHREEAHKATLRVHDRYLFVFRDDTLITAWLLPNHLKNRKAAQ